MVTGMPSPRSRSTVPLSRMSEPVISTPFPFSTEEGAECTAQNLTWERGLPAFDIVVHGEKYARVSLRVGGIHNVSNALAAASAAYVLGVPGTAVEEGLASFTGAGRRFEKKGTYHGADVYDDYAHHPPGFSAPGPARRCPGYSAPGRRKSPPQRPRRPASAPPQSRQRRNLGDHTK